MDSSQFKIMSTIADFLENTPDMIGDCQEFTKIYSEKTGTHFSGQINRKFIRKMVEDELQELDEAKDLAEEIDALLDAVYYILQHIATTGIDVRPIWKLIHTANMKKFGPGGRVAPNGKWLKPPDFVHPDDDIRVEIDRQLKNLQTG